MLALGITVDLAVFSAATVVACLLLRVHPLEALGVRGPPGRARLRRLLSLMAGPLTIYVAAVMCFALAGFLTPIPAAVVTVEPGLPADRAGVTDGDRVLSVNGVTVSSFLELRDEIRASGGAALRLELERSGVEKPIVTEVVSETGLIGVRPKGELVRVSPGRAFSRAVLEPPRYIVAAVNAMRAVASGEVESTPVGPVRLVAMARIGGLRWIAASLGSILSLPWPLFLLLSILFATMAEARSLLAREPVVPPV